MNIVSLAENQLQQVQHLDIEKFGKIKMAEMTISEILSYSSDIEHICAETHSTFPEEAIMKLNVIGHIERADKLQAKIERLNRNGFNVEANGRLVNRRHVKLENKQ